LADAVYWWDPRAVVVGEAAAAMTLWPELEPRRGEVATPRAVRSRAGFAFTRRNIPSELVIQRAGVRLAAPALTALDLVPEHGGDVIDRALRSRVTTLAEMRRALELSGHRVGNEARRLALLDSRSEPRSAAERLAHRLLRAAGIDAWPAKVPVVCDGQTFYLDIAMDRCPVVVEIDGKDHLRADMFDYDRWRGDLLLLAGKRVLHFTWKMLVDKPEWVVDTVRRAIALHDGR
jgi:very-short-patch-repair endonuclease